MLAHWFLNVGPRSIFGAGLSFLVLENVSWEAWCLHCWHLRHHFDNLGAPRATLGAAGRTNGVQNRCCCTFGMILGSHFESSSAPRAKYAVSFSGSFPWHSWHRFESKPRNLGLRNLGFCIECIAKAICLQKSFLRGFGGPLPMLFLDSGPILMMFGALGQAQN